MWMQRFNYKKVNTPYVKFKLPILKDSYLIQWTPKAKTIIHDHDNKDCDLIMLNVFNKRITTFHKIHR